MRLEFSAFRSRNYRLFVAGQSLSMIGHAMQQVALGWIVFSWTGSTYWLGLVAFAGQAPFLVTTPLAGALTDRYDKRRLLMGAQALGLASALALAILSISGSGNAWTITLVALVAGVAVSIEVPTRQALLVDLVEDKAHLHNAIAFYSLMFNVGRMLGPVAAGALIAYSGAWTCFAVNTAAYLALIAAMSLIKPPAAVRQPPPAGILRSLAQALAYVREREILWALIALTAVASFAFMPYVALMPAVVGTDHAAAPETLGLLLGAAGFGAVLGNLFLAAGGAPRLLPRRIALATCASGIALLAFSFVPVLGVRLLLMAILGWGYTVAMSACNIALQVVVREDQRGRVAAIYIMALLGLPPLGALAAGILAQHAGTALTLATGGLFGALAGLWLLAGSQRHARAIDTATA